MTENTLYYGDNLQILREHIKDESVDLIYLDPPFNSSRNYNILFKDETGHDSDAQITAFEDTWHWNEDTQRTYQELSTNAPTKVASMIVSLHQFIGANQMMAYLVMMAARIIELHRVLKPTGSLYLHCDPTASHYLKIVLDSIFSPENFRNEIVWKRTSARSDSHKWNHIHDIIFYYTKSYNYTWHTQYVGYDDSYIKKSYNLIEAETNRHYTSSDLMASGLRNGSSGKIWRGINPATRGNHWKYTIEKLDELDHQGRILWPSKPDGVPRYKRYLDEMSGVAIQSIITDIPPLSAQSAEKLGYPTQKPLTLLERIINASSNPGDVILDPFCGCGTAVHAAEKMGRKWLGIDITHLSISLIKYRLQDAFPGIKINFVGEPTSVSDAQHLASQDRFQFQWWALSLIKARPLGGQAGNKTGKKGADQGIDGIINFIDDNSGKPKTVIVQVKSGKTSSRDIRDLVGTIEREKSQMGVFLTLEDPTNQMTTEAATAGFYITPFSKELFPKVQISTIGTLLNGQLPKLPSQYGTFKQAPRETKDDNHKQTQFEL
jgi:site-specific DNA-methyltransferase (adenine-specific)